MTQQYGDKIFGDKQRGGGPKVPKTMRTSYDTEASLSLQEQLLTCFLKRMQRAKALMTRPKEPMTRMPTPSMYNLEAATSDAMYSDEAVLFEDMTI